MSKEPIFWKELVALGATFVLCVIWYHSCGTIYYGTTLPMLIHGLILVVAGVPVGRAIPAFWR